MIEAYWKSDSFGSSLENDSTLDHRGVEKSGVLIQKQDSRHGQLVRLRLVSDSLLIKKCNRQCPLLLDSKSRTICIPLVPMSNCQQKITDSSKLLENSEQLSGKLGVSLQGGSKYCCPVFVTSVSPSSPLNNLAARGDIILGIDANRFGISPTSHTHQHVAQLICHALRHSVVKGFPSVLSDNPYNLTQANSPENTKNPSDSVTENVKNILENSLIIEVRRCLNYDQLNSPCQKENINSNGVGPRHYSYTQPTSRLGLLSQIQSIAKPLSISCHDSFNCLPHRRDSASCILILPLKFSRILTEDGKWFEIISHNGQSSTPLFSSTEDVSAWCKIIRAVTQSANAEFIQSANNSLASEQCILHIGWVKQHSQVEWLRSYTQNTNKTNTETKLASATNNCKKYVWYLMVLTTTKLYLHSELNDFPNDLMSVTEALICCNVVECDAIFIKEAGNNEETKNHLNTTKSNGKIRFKDDDKDKDKNIESDKSNQTETSFPSVKLNLGKHSTPLTLRFDSPQELAVWQRAFYTAIKHSVRKSRCYSCQLLIEEEEQGGIYSGNTGSQEGELGTLTLTESGLRISPIPKAVPTQIKQEEVPKWSCLFSQLKAAQSTGDTTIKFVTKSQTKSDVNRSTSVKTQKNQADQQSIKLLGGVMAGQVLNCLHNFMWMRLVGLSGKTHLPPGPPVSASLLTNHFQSQITFNGV